MLVRLLLLALAVPVLRRLHERDRGQVFDLGGLGVTMLLTFSLSQHAGLGIQVPVAVTADALHLAAASVWLGGLVILAVALLWKRQPGELADVLPRWSRVAMVCVVTLVASGAYQTWREVGTLPALWETSYGRLLLGKWGGFVLLVALANAGRLWVRRWTPAPVLVAHAASSVEAVAKGRGRRIAGARPAPADGGGDATEPPAQSVGWLRRSVAAEAAIGAGVLALTALLVNDVPARVSYAPAYEAQVTGQDVSGRTIKVTLDVTTTKAGPETMHAYTYDAQGRVLPFASMTGDLEEAAKGLGPVRFTYANTGPGHGTAPAVVVPGSGRWTLTVQIVTPDGDDYAAATTYTVRS
jgi:copper transport protein